VRTFGYVKLNQFLRDLAFAYQEFLAIKRKNDDERTGLGVAFTICFWQFL
jgi:hypothetical protein